MENGIDNNMAVTGIPELFSNSAQETEQIGRLIGEAASLGLFVALNGDLGTGKTALTRGIARGLGIDGHITSPTFQLMREYVGRLTLYHFDFYRIGSAGEVMDLDMADCLNTGIVAAEWSGMFDEFASDDFVEIHMEWAGENERRIKFLRSGGSGTALVANVMAMLNR